MKLYTDDSHPAGPSPFSLTEHVTLMEEVQHLRSLPPWIDAFGGLCTVRINGASQHWRLSIPCGLENAKAGHLVGWQIWGNEDVIAKIAGDLLARTLTFVFAGSEEVSVYTVSREHTEGIIWPIINGRIETSAFLYGSEPHTDRVLQRALPDPITVFDPESSIRRAQEAFGLNALEFICQAPDAPEPAEKLS